MVLGYWSLVTKDKNIGNYEYIFDFMDILDIFADILTQNIGGLKIDHNL